MDERVRQEAAEAFEEALADSDIEYLFLTWKGFQDVAPGPWLDFWKHLMTPGRSQHLVILPCCGTHTVPLLRSMTQVEGLIVLVGFVGERSFCYVPCPKERPLRDYLDGFGLREPVGSEHAPVAHPSGLHLYTMRKESEAEVLALAEPITALNTRVLGL